MPVYWQHWADRQGPAVLVPRRHCGANLSTGHLTPPGTPNQPHHLLVTSQHTCKASCCYITTHKRASCYITTHKRSSCYITTHKESSCYITTHEGILLLHHNIQEAILLYHNAQEVILLHHNTQGVLLHHNTQEVEYDWGVFQRTIKQHSHIIPAD